MPATPPGFTPLTDDELDRLQAFFARQGGQVALNVEEMDGFFAALLVGPEMVPPREYLPVLLGSADPDQAPGFENIDEMNEFLSLAMRHWNAIAQAVQRNELYLPLILEKEAGDDDHRPAGHRWARGFMRGVEMRRSSWAPLIQDDDNGGAIFAIALLAGEVDEEFLDRPRSGEDDEDLLQHLVAGMHLIQKYFAPQRLANAALAAEAAESATVRRASPKVGRNDPCPCGSGRKYKQCCGRKGGSGPPDSTH